MLLLSKRVLVCIGITGLFLLSLSTAFGGEEEEESAPGIWSSFQETWSPRLDINLRSSYYYKDSDLEPNDFHLSSDATLSLSRALTDNLIFQIDPRGNFDSLYTAGVQLFVEDREYRPAFTLNEVLFSWYGDTAEVEVGKKIYSWKVADSYSPLDTLNPKDIIELMDPQKIGIPSVSVLKMFESVNIQTVWLPLFVPDRQPNEASRWAGDDPEGRAAFVERFGMEPVIIDAGRDLPDDKMDKMSVAVRLSSSTLLSGWDLAMVYRYGYSTQGVIRNDINPLTLPLVYQTTEYPAYNLFGLSFSTVSGDFEYHGEAGFHDSRDNLKDEDYLSYVAGVNYTNYDWLNSWFEELRFVVEYAGEEITQGRDSGSIYSNKGVGRGLASNIIGSIKFKIDEDHSIKTSYVYNVSKEDSLWDIYGESKLTDNLELFYGYQKLSGDPSTFFGQWDDNDRVYVQMAITY